MGGETEFFGAIISMISTLVEGYLKNEAMIRAFGKAGEIQDKVIGEMQNRYSNLENEIGKALIEQHQEQVTEETKKRVVTGNLISIAVAIVVIVIVVALALWILKDPKK